MTRPKNVLLHSPVQNSQALERLVEQCLKEGVELIAVWGPDCETLHDAIDDIVVGYGNDESRFILTSWHSDETLDEVREFMSSFENPEFTELRI